MRLSTWRLFALGLLTAGLGTAAVLVNAAPRLRSALPSGAAGAVGGTVASEYTRLHVADKAGRREEAKQPDTGVHIEAPSTEVKVDREGGKVSVRAPYTDVRVDPDKGRVRVRAPYVDLDIRW